MKRSYESPAPSTLLGTSISLTAKTLKVDNVRVKQTPLMKLALSSNKSAQTQYNDSEYTNPSTANTAEQDRSFRNTQQPILTNQFTMETLQNFSTIFQHPSAESTLFLIEERKKGRFVSMNDSNAWVISSGTRGASNNNSSNITGLTGMKKMGCLTFMLANEGLVIMNDSPEDAVTIQSIGAFETFSNRYLITFSHSDLSIHLYEYSEDNHKLSQIIRPVKTSGKTFYSFAMSSNGRIFLVDTSNRIYELINNFTQLKCVCSPLRPSVFSTVTSFIYSALTFSLSFDNDARNHNMRVFCDNSRNILYAFDTVTGSVTAYSTLGKEGELTQISTGSCALPDGGKFSELNRSIVLVAPVEGTVSQIVNFLVVYKCGLIDFYSVYNDGIDLRYRRSVVDLLRTASSNHSLMSSLLPQSSLSPSQTGRPTTRDIMPALTNDVTVKEATYEDGSFIFIVASNSQMVILHSTSIDLITGRENICYPINAVVSDEALNGSFHSKLKHFIICQDNSHYLRVPEAHFDGDLDSTAEVNWLFRLLTDYRRDSDFVNQLFKDPATFNISTSRALTHSTETHRVYPINKLEQFLRTRSHVLANFTQMFTPIEVFAMAIALYCRAGFTRASGPTGIYAPIPATDESSVDRVLADASKGLYLTFMGASGSMLRLEGTMYFVARMLQHILPCKICESKEVKYGKNFINRWTHDEALATYTYVSRAHELISSVQEQHFPISATRKVAAIRKILALVSSTLGLILTLTENDLQKVARRLSPQNQINITTFRVFQLAEERSLVFSIISSLIDISLDSFNKMCGILLERCPLFFSDTELARFRGMHALVMMKESLSAEKPLPQKEIERLAESSFAEFSKVPFLNVSHICRVYANFGLFDYIVKLGLGRAQSCELRQETMRLLSSSLSQGDVPYDRVISDPEELKKIDYKKGCYKVVLGLFNFLKTGVYPDVARRKIMKLSTKVTANETRRLITLAQEFKDELWHFELYQWFLDNHLNQDLLDITSTAEYVIKFLNSRGEIDLLWKYYIRQGRNKEGISCLYAKATSAEERIPIERRIEYFSIILNLLRVLKDSNSDQDLRISNIYANFELLKLQQEVVTIGKEVPDVLTQSEQLELTHRAFSFNELRDIITKKENYNFYVLSIELIRLEQNVTNTLRDVRNVYLNKVLETYNLPALTACAKRFYVEFPGDDSVAELYFPVNFVMEIATKRYGSNSEEFVSELLNLRGQKRTLWEPILSFYIRKFRAAGTKESAERWLKEVVFIGKKYEGESAKSDRLNRIILEFISEVLTRMEKVEIDQKILESLGEIRNALI